MSTERVAPSEAAANPIAPSAAHCQSDQPRIMGINHLQTDSIPPLNRIVLTTGTLLTDQRPDSISAN